MGGGVHQKEDYFAKCKLCCNYVATSTTHIYKKNNRKLLRGVEGDTVFQLNLKLLRLPETFFVPSVTIKVKTTIN